MTKRYFDVVEFNGRYSVREFIPSSTTVYCDRVVHSFTDCVQANDYATACDDAGRDIDPVRAGWCAHDDCECLRRLES